jgi:DNA helicase-2/ATP-dependent DNA helicase PcrA
MARMDIKTKFNTFFTESLNKEQQKAVAQHNGVLHVIAGAGSGKTRVITSRIIHLLVNHNVDPRSIIALTFTNKAAQEMSERVKSFVIDEFPVPFIGTFHSYCLQLLRIHGHLLDLPTFSILDSDDQKQLLTSIIKRKGLDKRVTAKAIGYQLSQFKNKVALGEKESQLVAQEPLLPAIYQAYEHEKSASKCLDFDDLLLEVLKLLKKNPAFKQHLESTISHILVDEYQDTNIVQHQLLQLLSHSSLTSKQRIVESLCVVGDEDQSIYSWRGATVKNMVNFHKDFTEAQTIKIEQNYRSVQPILDAANHVIKNNEHRNPKKLWSDREGKDRIRVITCMSGLQEGDAIVYFLKQLKTRTELSSCALLYRAHYQSRAVEEALIRHNIPYKMISGVQFYERKEIKDILAYLRLAVNPYDRVSFLRIINCPPRGLGAKFEEELLDAWIKEPLLSCIELLKHMIAQGSIKGKKEETIQNFINVIQTFSASAEPSKAIINIVERIKYVDYLKESFDPEDAESRIENIKELIRASKFFTDNNKGTIETFLHEVTLMQEHSKDKHHESECVQLMTLHAAKGLEFETVILSGLEDGTFPSARTMYEDNALEEERRLFYVGLTRAKDRLLLSHARFRYTYGQMTDCQGSRFLDELPSKNVIRDDLSSLNSYQISQYMADWLGTNAPATIMTFGSQAAKPLSKVSAIPAKRITKKDSSASSVWKKNQMVKHKTFGIGYIKDVDTSGTTEARLTIQFTDGIKKVHANFVESM